MPGEAIADALKATRTKREVHGVAPPVAVPKLPGNGTRKAGDGKATEAVMPRAKAGTVPTKPPATLPRAKAGAVTAKHPATLPRNNLKSPTRRQELAPQDECKSPRSVRDGHLEAVVITRGGLHSPMPKKFESNAKHNVTPTARVPPDRVGIPAEAGLIIKAAHDSEAPSPSNQARFSSSLFAAQGGRESRSSVAEAIAKKLGTKEIDWLCVQSPELGDQIKEMLTFDDCQELKRGAAISTVLRRGASVFTSSSGSVETYALSKRVGTLGAFVSHNWSTRGYLKFMALTFYFNFDLAAAISVALLVVLGTASLLGVLPTVQDKLHEHPVGFVCQTVCIPFFLGVILFVRDLQNCFTTARYTLFLDVLCIDQTSNDTKRKGIEKLGAFLRNSEVMIALYTDMYLQKLWTVFELASFLALHPIKHLVIMPVFKARAYYILIMSVWLCFILNVPLQVAVKFWRIRSILAGPSILAITIYFRSWARQKQRMRVEFMGFSVRKCMCACEDDRPIVYGNIAKLMKATLVPHTSSDDEALDAFDNLAHTTLPDAFLFALGDVSFSYKHLAILCILVYGADAADELAALPKEGLGNLALVLDRTWRACFQLPVTIAINELGVSYKLHWYGLKNVCWVTVVAVLTLGGLIAHDQALLRLTKPPVGPHVLIILAALNCVGPLLPLLVYRGCLQRFADFMHKFQPRQWQRSSVDTE